MKEVHKLFIDNISSDCSDKGVDHSDDIDSEETLPDHDHQSSNASDVDECDDSCGKEAEDDAEDSAEEEPDLILMSYCDFLNRLSNFQFVPQTTIKVIAEEYMKNYNKSNEVKYAFLKESLNKIPGFQNPKFREFSRTLKRMTLSLMPKDSLILNIKGLASLQKSFHMLPLWKLS